MIFNLSSLLQCQISEIQLCNAFHTPAHKLRRKRQAKSQPPQSPLSISQSSPQSGRRPQCLKQERILFQTILHLSSEPSCQRHLSHLRLPCLCANPNAFVQLHNRLGYNSSQCHGYFASPNAWIFEENGIILSASAFKAAASDPDTLSFDQAMTDIEHVTKWMEAAAKEVASLEKNGTWKEVNMLEAKTKNSPRDLGIWCKQSPGGEITNYKCASVFEATLKKENLKPMLQLLPGVQSDCFLSCP